MNKLIGGKRVFGVSGWKNSGKTTLVTRIVSELTARGFKVSTLKHAHHNFDIDHEGTDSFRHREAGAGEVAIVSAKRIAIMTNNTKPEEPGFDEILSRMSYCDIVIVEGFKRETCPKIEVFGETPERRKGEQLWQSDETVLAIAAENVPEGCTLPVFSRNDVNEITDFIQEYWKLK